MSRAGAVVALGGDASSLVRVTVASGSRRVDLALPGAVPVAELLPELARSVGLLNGVTVYAGYRAVTAGGRVLAGDAGLSAQGVEDGSLVVVTVGADEPMPQVYDDVVEAMVDAVERDLHPWLPAAGRRTALAAATLFLLLGAVALLVQDSRFAALTACLVAGGLGTGAVVLGLFRREQDSAVALAWIACAYAVVAGLLIAPGRDLDGLALVSAAIGLSTVGLVCIVGLGAGRALLIPPVVGGVALLGSGLVVRAVGIGAADVLTSLLVLVVVAGSGFPRLALAVLGTQVDQPFDNVDAVDSGEGNADGGRSDPVDAAQVAADMRTAHQILLALSATIGLLLVLVGPVAVSLGWAGTVLSVACCVVVMLRSRHHRSRAGVLVGLVSGVLGLAASVLAALWWHPEWRPATAVTLAAIGALLVTATLLPSAGLLRRGLWGDVAESLAVLSLLPLAVVATGLLESVRR